MPVQNPFFHRGPIRDPAYFFGREHETRQILSLLGNGQSVSLVGQRRIGKTSLLFHLANADVSAPFGIYPDEHLFVYIDCGGLNNLDQQSLYRVFLEEIDDALSERKQSDRLEILADSQPVTYRAFERSLRKLIRQGRKPIFLLDEFERMSLNPHLDPDFFSGLRALAARHRISYVTASKHPLLALTYADASTLSSPFFNIFANVRLGLFTNTVAHKFLVRLAEKGNVDFNTDTLKYILNLAGPHPLFLQIAGFHAFELLQENDKPVRFLKPDRFKGFKDELRRRFLASVEEHYGYYWRNLTNAEQFVLATLPASQNSQPDVARRLEQECLIVHHDDYFDYLSPTFRDFVQAQPVSGLLQAGPLAIDKNQHQVLLHGQILSLTATQYTLLLHLVEQAGQVVTTEDLEQAVWVDEYIEDPERLKSVIKGLRRTLGDESTRLENVRGVGFIWRS